MPDWIDPIRLLDAILILILFEMLGLGLWLRARRAGGLIAPLALFLLSGALLMLAIRTSLSGTGATPALFVLLALAGLAHVGCLITGWKAARKRLGPDRRS